MLERILVGTDASDAADHALSTALRLARAAGAQIRAVHALDRPQLPAAVPAETPSVSQRHEEEGNALVQGARDRAEEHGVEASTHVREAEPGELLLDEAARWPADLLAVGTHGHGPLSRAVLGSVADRLVREAPCPVLTARQPPARSPSDPIERIVVPSDGSSPATSAWPVARDLAHATGAGIDLVYAVPPELEGGKYLDRPTTEVDEVHEEMAAQALDPFEARCEEAGIGCARFVRHGPPHREIGDHAEQRGADLVVMATRGHGGLERVLVGSVASRMLRSSPTPVVTVGPRASD